jgi:hypothetical protein
VNGEKLPEVMMLLPRDRLSVRRSVKLLRRRVAQRLPGPSRERIGLHGSVRAGGRGLRLEESWPSGVRPGAAAGLYKLL